MAGGLQISCRESAQQPIPTGSLGSHTVCHSPAGAGCSGIVSHVTEQRQSLSVQAGVPNHVLCLVGGSGREAKRRRGLGELKSCLSDAGAEHGDDRCPKAHCARWTECSSGPPSAGPGRADDLVRDAGQIPWTLLCMCGV